MEVLEVKKERRIDEIFNILVQYEKIGIEITEEDYVSYLDRLYTWYSGYDDNVATGIKGLLKFGVNISHDSVRRMTFYLISLVERKES